MAALVTGWEMGAAPPVIGVAGPRALLQRLSCSLLTRQLLPHDAPVADVDAVLVARSALAPDGGWSGALRPSGFDRGAVLASMLAAARTDHVPVVLLDDLPPAVLDGWDRKLDGAVDDALRLGPLGVAGVGWHPGEHWDAAALRLAVTRSAAAATDPRQVTTGDARREWRAAQRLAVAAGRVELDGGDPWSAHLARELAGLGVEVRGVGAAEVRRDGATPTGAAAWLCARLGLPSPQDPLRPPPVTVTNDDTGAAVACRDAVDRACVETGLAVRARGAVAATPDLAEALAASAGPCPDELALDLEALA